MEIKITKKPSKITGRTINEVREKVTRNACYSIGNNYNGYIDDNYRSNDRKIIAFNIEKKNAVRVRDKKTNKYKTIKPAEVTAYYYEIPIQLLQLAGLKFEQKSRNFELKRK